jgi:hypothetical protein
MRLIGIFLVCIAAAAFQTSWAQALPEEYPAISQERDPSKSVRIYPNPATEYLIVKLNDFPAEKARLTLHTIIGNQMEIESEIAEDENQEKVIRVKVKDLASGYYLLAVKDDESKFRGTYKFLKR